MLGLGNEANHSVLSTVGAGCSLNCEAVWTQKMTECNM